MGVRYEPWVREEARRLYREGVIPKWIGGRLGVPQGTVTWWCRDIPTPERPQVKKRYRLFRPTDPYRLGE